MIAAQLDEPLVQSMGDHFAVVRTRLEGTIEDRFQLQGIAHSPELEVPQPQVSVREAGVAAIPVEHVGGLSGRRYLSHRRLASVRTRDRVGAAG